MKRLAAITAVLFLALPGVSGADLIGLDALTAGDGLLTRDTDTGLEWLDVTYTTFTSAVDVDSLLESDPFLSTFRRATAAEVNTLFLHAGFAAFGVFDTTNVAAAQVLTGLLGDTLAGMGSRHGSIGMLADTIDEPLPIRTASYFTDFLVLGSLTGYALSPDGQAMATVSFEHIGHYLVRDEMPAPVPEPASMLLLGTGVSVLAGIRRHRAKKRS